MTVPRVHGEDGNGVPCAPILHWEAWQVVASCTYVQSLTILLSHPLLESTKYLGCSLAAMFFRIETNPWPRRRCAGERVEWVPRKLRCFTRAARHSVCLWLQLLAAKTCHYCSFRRCLNQGSAVIKGLGTDFIWFLSRLHNLSGIEQGSLSYAVLGGIKMTFWCVNSGFRTLPGELFKVLEHQKIGHLVYLARFRCSDYYIGRYQRKA